MRKYKVCFWIEKNDESVDCEDFVRAHNFEEAYEKFKAKNIVLKRIVEITQIKEV